MSNDLAVIRDAINDFQKVQKRMLLAKEENAVRTYADLKEDYVSLNLKSVRRMPYFGILLSET